MANLPSSNDKDEKAGGNNSEKPQREDISDGPIVILPDYGYHYEVGRPPESLSQISDVEKTKLMDKIQMRKCLQYWRAVNYNLGKIEELKECDKNMRGSTAQCPFMGENCKVL